MKIVQINSVVNTGSTGKIAEAIGNEIRSFGGDSVIAYGRDIGSGLSQSRLFRIGNKVSNFLDLVMSRIFDNQGFNSHFVTKRFLQFLENTNPDVIHLHNLHGYYINIDLLLTWAGTRGTPVVLTLHDCWTFTGHCAYFDMVNCEKWRVVCSTCPQRNAYPSAWFWDRSRENFEKKLRLWSNLKYLTTVSVSHWLDGHVKNSMLGHAEREVIHNGVDLDVFSPRDRENVQNLRKRFNIGPEPIVLGVANVWDKRKGLMDLIQASESLGVDHKLVVIGLSESQIQNLPENVLGLGRTENQRELASFYQAADVYVNPTYEDNFPTTNLEALACGTPVVTYRTGGSAEAIDMFTGRSAERGDVRTLAKEIRSILSSKGEMRTRCRERAARYFDDKAVFKEYVRLYQKIIEQQKVRRLAKKPRTA